MKIQTKNQNPYMPVFEGLRSAAKILWSKFVLKGKSFQPLPNEAPH